MNQWHVVSSIQFNVNINESHRNGKGTSGGMEGRGLLPEEGVSGMCREVKTKVSPVCGYRINNIFFVATKLPALSW